MKVSSGRSKRTPGQSCRPGLTEWVFCMFFSVTLACVAAVLSFRSLLHIQEEKYRPGFLEASTSIAEAPTEPPVEAVLVFDSAMPGMLPKAVWHSKASQAVVPPLPPNTAGIEGLVQRTQVTTSAPNCEVLLPDLANRLAKDLHSAQEQRNLDLAVQAWKGLLSGKIQVDYMRQRLCSRMEAWFKSLTTMSWQSPRGVTSVLVWPQAAYLHFGVKRVWSLGEYTQWADLCAALATLGLQVKLWPFQKKSFPTLSIYDSVNAVYTDYNGVHAGKGVGARPPPDKTWLLDTFGTDGTVVANDFFGRIPPLTDYPLHRFLTLVPGYSSRNTFLGVAAVAGSTEASTLLERRWQCVLWSKVHPWLAESNGFPAYHWKLLREYTKYCKVIATVDIKDTYKTAELIRTCCPAVEIREVQSPKAFQELIRGSAVYVGVGEPLIAPSCFEALSLGTHVVQPRFPEPRMLKNKPITQNWTSQHPFLEQIPEPYAFTIDPLNFEALGATFRALRNAFDSVYGEADTPLTARESKAMRNFYLSGDYPGREEFSISGFLKRVAGTVTKTRTLEAADWDWERGDHPQQLPARAFQS